MNNQINAANEQLENAFELFNQFSEKLAGSYSDLELHVTRLTKELAEARNERLVQLAEKEILAKRLEGLLDALPAGIVVLDADDCITQTNPVARSMLVKGTGDNKFTGQKWEGIAQQSINTQGNELSLVDGRWVNLSVCSLCLDNEGMNKGKIILISDISETRMLQMKLNRQHRLTSLGEMIASLAHQVRTPLSSALLYISTLNHPLNDDEQRACFADKAAERLRHLERMVNDMLMFARGDVSKSEYINANEIIIQLKNIVKPQARIKEIVFDIDSNLKNISIQANRDVLLSAFQNVIDNAIEACSDVKNYEMDSSDFKKIKQRRITIKAFFNFNNQFEISIKDNGRGMTEAVKNKILEPFFTTKKSGTGLGLSVVNTSINRYGGEMLIDSKVGEGSNFTIKLPRAEVMAMLPSQLNRSGRMFQKKRSDNVNNTALGKNLMNEKFKIISNQEVAL